MSVCMRMMERFPMPPLFCSRSHCQSNNDNRRIMIMVGKRGGRETIFRCATCFWTERSAALAVEVLKLFACTDTGLPPLSCGQICCCYCRSVAQDGRPLVGLFGWFAVGRKLGSPICHSDLIDKSCRGLGSI